MKEKLQKSVEIILKSAFPRYDKDKCGYCARAVRNAIEGGFGVTIQRPKSNSAKDYGTPCEKVGFKKIFTCNAGSAIEYDLKKVQFKPQLGDIAIVQYEPHGHISMFSGQKWVSDFIQIDLFGGEIREKRPPFSIYRYEPEKL